MIPVISMAQDEKKEEYKIPVKDGKVVFSYRYNNEDLNANDIDDELHFWLKKNMPEEKVVKLEDDKEKGLIMFRPLDLLEMRSTSWTNFSIYVKYDMVFKYKDNSCMMVITNIGYIEPEVINARQGRLSDIEMTVYSAEHVLLDKEYKILGKKNVSDEISKATVKRFRELFKSVSLQLSEAAIQKE